MNDKVLYWFFKEGLDSTSRPCINCLTVFLEPTLENLVTQQTTFEATNYTQLPVL